MKINTFIITILNIKIEDSKFTALIFKCLQYIDQHNPVSFQREPESESEKGKNKKTVQVGKKISQIFIISLFF